MQHKLCMAQCASTTDSSFADAMLCATYREQAGIMQMSVSQLADILQDPDQISQVQLVDVREEVEESFASLPHFQLKPLSRWSGCIVLCLPVCWFAQMSFGDCCDIISCGQVLVQLSCRHPVAAPRVCSCLFCFALGIKRQAAT